ncbi:hypothetical protein N7524_001359 [Penicillium chrysogenum]|nr:hypothetical protein N7524_001359 [Penicillium chrysogenum]
MALTSVLFVDKKWPKIIDEGNGQGQIEEERAYSLPRYDVDGDALFVVRIPASSDKSNEAADDDQAPERKTGALDESVVFDLVEFLELVEPSNTETLRMKLSTNGTRADHKK